MPKAVIHSHAKNAVIGLGVFLIVLGIGTFFARDHLSDWLYERKAQEAVPEPVAFDEIPQFAREALENPINHQGIAPIEQLIPPAPVELESLIDPEEEDKPIEEEEESLPPIDVPEPLPEDSSGFPASFNLAVPFTPQAPHANWDLPYQETCEESSILMVHQFYEGVKGGKIDAEEADEELLKLVDFQTALFGYFEDTTAEQSGMLAERFYGYSKVEVIENPTVEQMKGHIIEGRPIIIPAAGQKLGNPFFSGLGPPYHMLVVRGYTEQGFITNDPGTRRGDSYVYSYQTLMNAIHDWTGSKETVEEGAKRVLVIYPEE